MKLAESLGLELVEVELFRAGSREVVRIYVDRPGGVTLEEISKLSRALSESLDADELFDDKYTLEVSSPGLDRPLRTPRDWARRVGLFVRVHLSEEVGGHRTWIGLLVRTGDESAVIQAEKTKEEVEIPFRTVSLARVDVRFEE